VSLSNGAIYEIFREPSPGKGKGKGKGK
jgi:hypothetical protein